jgi:hypothetical protein
MTYHPYTMLKNGEKRYFTAAISDPKIVMSMIRDLNMKNYTNPVMIDCKDEAGNVKSMDLKAFIRKNKLSEL